MKNQTFISLSSLALDLKRISLGIYRGSKLTVSRFEREALERSSEIKTHEVDPYIKKILDHLPSTLEDKNSEKKAEALLTYSILLQNYASRKSLAL